MCHFFLGLYLALFWASLHFYSSYFKNPAAACGFTPLHFAAQEGHTEICKFLIEIVEDKNPLNKTGLSLLHCAANKGRLETYKLIMEHFKDKNPKNSIHGMTPLHYAANKGHFEMCKFILGIIGKANL